jgi:hypothetical protein
MWISSAMAARIIVLSSGNSSVPCSYVEIVLSVSAVSDMSFFFFFRGDERRPSASSWRLEVLRLRKGRCILEVECHRRLEVEAEWRRNCNTFVADVWAVEWLQGLCVVDRNLLAVLQLGRNLCVEEQFDLENRSDQKLIRLGNLYLLALKVGTSHSRKESQLRCVPA